MLPLHRALLLVLACLCLLVMSAAHAKRVALVVGVSDYEHAGRLANPANDAREVARRLRVFGDVEELWQRSPRKTDMDAALVRLRQRAANADAVVVFFAGHGIELGGQNWMLPADARLQDERDVRREAIGLDDVLAEIRSNRRGRVNMVFLDACRDNPFRSRFVQSGRNISRGLGRPAESPNDTLIAFATAPGEVARDGNGSAHSPFTQALLSVMDKEPGLEVGLLLRRVRARVLQATDGRQQPWESGSLVSEFYFANPFGRVTPEDERRMEDEAWELAKRLNTLASYQEYLATYPQGRLAAAAMVAVAGLQPVPVATPGPAPASVVASRTPGQVLSDCKGCPEMVVLPAGQFSMGSAASEDDRDEDEGPVRTVSLGYPFALSRTEVTFEQWDRCVAAGGCSHRPGDGGWGRGTRPVIDVSWQDAQQYARWLSQVTGQNYRLPSEAEWEYACRAAARGQLYCGGNNMVQVAWTVDNSGGRTQPVGRKAANAWGLHDMSGNVWEWVQDCYSPEAYADRAPSDGRAHEPAWCSLRVLRGGSWNDVPTWARAAKRLRDALDVRNGITGFRLARMLP